MFVFVSDGESTPTSEVAESARTEHADYAVIAFEGRPEAVVAVDRLAEDEAGPVSDRLDLGTSLVEGLVGVRLGDAHVDLRVWHSPEHVLVEVPHVGVTLASIAEGESLERQVELVAAAARDELRLTGMLEATGDIFLPSSDPLPPVDPLLTYWCSSGHPVEQRASNPNRSCPLHQTPLTR